MLPPALLVLLAVVHAASGEFRAFDRRPIEHPLTLLAAQCPIGTTMSFEKIASVTIRGVPFVPLYNGQPDMSVNAFNANNNAIIIIINQPLSN